MMLVAGFALANTGIGGFVMVAGLLCWAASVVVSRTLRACVLGLCLGALGFIALAVVFFGTATLIQRAGDHDQSSDVVTPSARAN